MIAVLKRGTTPEQTEHLINWLKHMNLEIHISTGKEFTILKQSDILAILED